MTLVDMCIEPYYIYYRCRLVYVMQNGDARRCRKNKMRDLGFIDPERVNKDVIDRSFDDTYGESAGMIRDQLSKSYFLLPYIPAIGS